MTTPETGTMKILSTSQAAEAIGVSTRQIRNILKKHKVEGAVKVGRDWAIPEAAIGKPPLEFKRPKPGPKVGRKIVEGDA